jgi:transposase
VPPKPLRALRTLTRYRKTQIAERQREANRLHKALEDAGIKLDRVASDILGASGRAMLDALCQGTTDPAVLAELARGRLRAKLPALRAALEGRFDAQHALVVGAILAHLDFLDEQIERLSAAIAEALAPFAPAVELLCSIPGVGRRTAEVIIAEIGTDMSRFPAPGTWPAGPASARATTPRPGAGARGGRARAPSGWARRLRRRRSRPAAAPWAIPPPSTGACARAGATGAPSAPSSTPSSWPAGTCSAPESSTATWAGTTSSVRTP